MASRPLKAWDSLSTSYRKRLARHGITERNYATPEGARLRTAARGHGATPERPERINPSNREKYARYVENRSTLIESVNARKERMFGDRVKYKPSRAEQATKINPNTNKAPKIAYLKAFLAMSEGDIFEIDWSQDEWGFLYYH